MSQCQSSIVDVGTIRARRAFDSCMTGEWQLRAVRIIVTGGTIDKVHDMLSEGLGFEPSGSSHLPDILRQARCYFPEVQQIMLKDSLELTAADRATMLDAVLSAPEDGVVITHGTSTMGETTRYLDGRVGNKTVVLTGAMRPFSLGMSDGAFNLGCAIAGAQLLAAGVWATMNGRLFPALNVAKNEVLGRFDV